MNTGRRSWPGVAIAHSDSFLSARAPQNVAFVVRIIKVISEACTYSYRLPRFNEYCMTI